MVAGDPDRSVLALRMASRNPVAAMPPLGSRIVDDEAVALIRRWIAEEIGTDVSKHKSVEDR
jgi:mono/diheme cytochrome c family protein